MTRHTSPASILLTAEMLKASRAPMPSSPMLRNNRDRIYRKIHVWLLFVRSQCATRP
jgi:hypothetical protein